ncbi:hypothetical protein F5Y04DRAFT_292040 [Hypomontagnella monticulosa]|nr:hypothetical protein F5Y04DRAFT_292040 [Hypomontagnella monticulosa]
MSLITADYIRECFGETTSKPKNPTIQTTTRAPMRGRDFRHSMAELDRIVDKDEHNVHFERLPYDIRSAVFEILDSMPSWVHFKMKPERGKYGEARLADFKGRAQEIHTNKEWYEARSLRHGLSRVEVHGPRTIEKIAAQTLNILVGQKDTLERLQNRHWRMDSPFLIRLKRQVKTPMVKRRLDWFFFDGPLDVQGQIRPTWSDFPGIHSIRTCVFRLDDMFDAINAYMYLKNNHMVRKSMPPCFVWDRGSQVEEIVIIVGEFRADVKPSEMEVITRYRIARFPETDARMINIDGHRVFEPIFTTIQFPESQRHMMKEVTGRFESDLYRIRRGRYQWLDTESGQRWLTYIVHNRDNVVSEWLDSVEGHMWLRSKGQQFLGSESGRWWLASSFGRPWLETKAGMDWLTTEPGGWFINSVQALHWANTNPSWLGTDQGQQWYTYQYHNGALQNLPPPPQRAKHQPPELDWPELWRFKANHRFLGWRFVMCPPRDVGQSSSSGSHSKGKGKEVAR